MNQANVLIMKRSYREAIQILTRAASEAKSALLAEFQDTLLTCYTKLEDWEMTLDIVDQLVCNFCLVCSPASAHHLPKQCNISILESNCLTQARGGSRRLVHHVSTTKLITDRVHSALEKCSNGRISSERSDVPC